MGQWYWYQRVEVSRTPDRTRRSETKPTPRIVDVGKAHIAACGGMAERVRILRVFGRESQVVLPQRIAAGVVAEIGDYCFSEKEPQGDYGICSDKEYFEGKDGISEVDDQGESLQDIDEGRMQDQQKSFRDQAFARMCRREGMHSLSGKNVTGVELPDSIKKIGNFAFYQCRELEKIVLGMGEMEVGSDAFMNCRHLSSFYFRGSPGQGCCLKQILAQRSGETAVYFTEGDQVRAALLYPEYSEHYDLIGPAHIFELNIQGEGFRARQCFQNGKVDFGAYDRIFSMEWGEESADTLCRMACFRLQFPWGLQERERALYQTYVSENIDSACEMLVKDRNLSGIQALHDWGLMKPDSLRGCLERAVRANWTEGVRQMLSLGEEDGRGGGDAYAFEDL